MTGAKFPWWRPDRYAARQPFLDARQRIVAALRNLFGARGFAEVDTPALQISPGLEPHLKAFATQLESPGGTHWPLYLHTSPEFTMKKLLVAGLPRIYQLARVFRNGERSATHHPEFCMLEWYRAEAGYRSIMGDCEELLRVALAATGGMDGFRWQGRRANPFGPWEYLSVADAFHHHAGINLLATIGDPHMPAPHAFAAAAERIGISPHAGDSWEDIFFRVFLDRIEPKLGVGQPTILYDYPVSMAALARPKPEDPRLAERFELYVCGMELANAFGELTDAEVQRRRFIADMDKKQALYGTRYPIDEDFLSALAHGMPESAGIALGVDRLVMLCTGAEHIEQVIWAPVADGA
ncbi:MAG: EF-P lysine aminoacylase GenX [Alphaproteobacteria bacterium]|nr:EF-P lysine aminoacylase GenX [Alphaproteobacteria bacterium]